MGLVCKRMMDILTGVVQIVYLLSSIQYFEAESALRLEEFYSYTEKIQQKRTRKTKQRKTMYSEQLYTITILTLNKSIQAVQLIY